MKKEKIIYLSKVSCVFTIFLLIFSYIFSFVMQITTTNQTSISVSTSLFLAYFFGLLSISFLAQYLALKLVNKPKSV